MTIETDLHVHSIHSTCGFHTLLELVSIIGKLKNIRAFALTDHGPVHDTPRSHFSVMLRRMPKFIEDIRVFKGIESTILSEDGIIDLPEFSFGKPYEIVLAGLHNYGIFERPQGREVNTRAVINTLRRNPKVKVITHPFFRDFPLDLDAVTDVALETGTALEINNSYLLNRKADTDALDNLLEHAGEKGTLLCIDSDGHMFNEVCRFDMALDFLKRHGGAENFTIVNRTLNSTLEFLGIEC